MLSHSKRQNYLFTSWNVFHSWKRTTLNQHYVTFLPWNKNTLTFMARHTIISLIMVKLFWFSLRCTWTLCDYPDGQWIKLLLAQFVSQLLFTQTLPTMTQNEKHNKLQASAATIKHLIYYPPTVPLPFAFFVFQSIPYLSCCMALWGDLVPSLPLNTKCHESWSATELLSCITEVHLYCQWVSDRPV